MVAVWVVLGVLGCGAIVVFGLTYFAWRAIERHIDEGDAFCEKPDYATQMLACAGRDHSFLQGRFGYSRAEGVPDKTVCQSAWADRSEAPNGAPPDGAPPDSALAEAMPAPVSIGRVWYDVEAGGNCHGIWTRVGMSSQFSAAWPDCGVTAQLTITVVGANVFVTRTNSSDRNDCHYAGVLAPDGLTVSGTYSCTVVSTAGSPGWSARIM